MITEETVFILGAGASKPYGYPTGKELRNYICNNFINDYLDSTKLPHHSSQIHKIEEIINAFSKSNNKSIDLFLTRHPEYEDLGKKIITFSIIKNEISSKNPEKLMNDQEDWFSELFELLTDELTEPVSYNRILENDISFITFNYDRSLEHFLFESLNNSFKNIDAKEIAKVILQISIIHVYGKITDLPWEDSNQFKGYRDFKLEYCADYANNINVIYSSRVDEERITRAKTLIKDADRIFFLGFGFAKENLDILNIKGNINGNQKIYGTAYGLSKNEILKKKSYFSKTYKADTPDLIIENCDCLTLLKNYL